MGQAKKNVSKTIYQTVEIEGQQIRLPKPTRGRNLTKAQKIEVTKAICKLYASDQYTLEHCTKAVGIHAKTFFNWKTETPEIAEIFNNTCNEKQQLYKHNLLERAKTAAEKLASGYKVDLITQKQEVIEQVEIIPDENGGVQIVQKGEGNQHVIIKEVQKKQIFIKPSPAFVQFILTNLDSDNFKRNPTGTENNSTGTNIPLIDWVD